MEKLLKARSALVLVLGLATVGSLELSAQTRRMRLTRRTRISRPGFAGPRMQNEEEIAELEARLAELKKAKEEEEEAARLAARVPLSAEEVKEFDATTFSYRKKVANVKDANIASELLSESWKEEEEAPSIGGSVLPVVGGVLLFVVLALVPSGAGDNYIQVGDQNVQYESPEQIRARYAGIEADD
eukprot:CAMPEP_0119075298 /NCGR_PEP_ID=MMETSP1178-20130426/79018_1 /TAXON_ID=33656 /ORGANISM="unid sp, Strain CCMP2000" /LENGTH=185 /DNA_ID=CAMNT_0007057511 /DNA_START=18 /DNA_END=575 /DNA_ORIENTATION=+